MVTMTAYGMSVYNNNDNLFLLALTLTACACMKT